MWLFLTFIFIIIIFLCEPSLFCVCGLSEAAWNEYSFTKKWLRPLIIWGTHPLLALIISKFVDYREWLHNFTNLYSSFWSNLVQLTCHLQSGIKVKNLKRRACTLLRGSALLVSGCGVAVCLNLSESTHISGHLSCLHGSCEYWQTETIWLRFMVSCRGLGYPSHVESSVCGWRGCWPHDSGTKSMAEITGFRYQGPLSHSGRLHINLCEKIIKGLFFLISELFILALKNTTTHTIAQLHRHSHILTCTKSSTHVYRHAYNCTYTHRSKETIDWNLERIVRGQEKANNTSIKRLKIYDFFVKVL